MAFQPYNPKTGTFQASSPSYSSTPVSNGLGQGLAGAFAGNTVRSVAEPLINTGGFIEKVLDQTLGRVINAVKGNGFTPTKTGQAAMDTAAQSAQQHAGGFAGGAGDVVGTIAPYFTGAGEEETAVRVAQMIPKLAETLGVRAESLVPKIISFLARNAPTVARDTVIGTAQTGDPVEGLGLGVGGAAAHGISGTAGSLVNKALKGKSAFETALEISRPKITPTLEQQAFNEGRVGQRTMFSGAPIAPSATETRIAEAIQPLVEEGRITAKMAESNPSAVKSEIDQEVHGINQGVKQLINQPKFNAPFTENQLNKYLQSAKADNKILFGGDTTLERAYDTVIDEFKTYVRTKNVSGLFDARQEFDSFIRSKYPNVFKPNKLGIINPADNVKQNALLDIRTAANEMVADMLDSAKIQSARKTFEPSVARPLIERAKAFGKKSDFIRNVKENMPKYKETELPSGTSRKTQTTMNTKNQYPTSVDEDLGDLWDIAHTKIDATTGDAYAAALRRESSLLRASENLGTKVRGITQKGKVQAFLDSPRGKTSKEIAKYATGGIVGAGVIGAGSNLLRD